MGTTEAGEEESDEHDHGREPGGGARGSAQTVHHQHLSRGYRSAMPFPPDEPNECDVGPLTARPPPRHPRRRARRRHSTSAAVVARAFAVVAVERADARTGRRARAPRAVVVAAPRSSACKRKATGEKGHRSWRRRAGDASSSATPLPAATEDAAQVAEISSTLDVADMRAALLAYGLKPGGRQKAVMALRLMRARRAHAASEARYGDGGGGGSSSISAGLPPRFDALRAGHVGHSLDACRHCAGPLESPRKTFCSDECVHFHLLRTSGSHVR